MRAVDACGLPYVRNGDRATCWLTLNHDGSCEDANRAAFIDSLRERTAAATYDRWVF